MPKLPVITNIGKRGFSKITIRDGKIKTERQITFSLYTIRIPIKPINAHVFTLLTKTTSFLGTLVIRIKGNGSKLNKTDGPLVSQLGILSYLLAQSAISFTPTPLDQFLTVFVLQSLFFHDHRKQGPTTIRMLHQM